MLSRLNPEGSDDGKRFGRGSDGHASAMPHLAQLDIPVSCPKCGSVGTTTWAIAPAVDTKKEARVLIDVSHDFCRAAMTEKSADTKILCDRCGTQVL
jgi:DNA-directed RNA polymerase subunit RPC12/RpoP